MGHLFLIPYENGNKLHLVERKRQKRKVPRRWKVFFPKTLKTGSRGKKVLSSGIPQINERKSAQSRFVFIKVKKRRSMNRQRRAGPDSGSIIALSRSRSRSQTSWLQGCRWTFWEAEHLRLVSVLRGINDCASPPSFPDFNSWRYEPFLTLPAAVPAGAATPDSRMRGVPRVYGGIQQGEHLPAPSQRHGPPQPPPAEVHSSPGTILSSFGHESGCAVIFRTARSYSGLHGQ